VLSVVVRSGPVVSAVNGTLVARLARMTWHPLAPSVHRDYRVRPVLGDYCLVGGSSGLTTSLSASFDRLSYLRAARPTSALAVRR
jgi:hypothetical protein